MKWVFLLAIIFMVPGLAAVLRGNPRYLVHSSFLLGVSIFVLGPSLWAAPIPWPGWPGPVKGVELSFVDALSVALIASTKPVPIPPWIKAAFGIFCFSLVVSTIIGSQWMPAMFYEWQLFRSVLLFVAIARVCGTTEGAPIALVAGLGLGLLYEALVAVDQYHNGVQRPGGNLSHSNFLGLASDFVVFPAVSLMLGTRRFLWPALVLLAGLVIALVGGSRATLGLFAIGFVLTLIFSLQHGSTPRKMAIGGVAVLFLLISAPAMLWAANQRSEQMLISSDSEREAMKDAARMIIADHPFGVGANQYVVVANIGGYSQRAGVPWNYANRSAPVHNTYYLVTAELGFIGLIGFVATLLSFVALGIVQLRRKWDDDSNELVPGLLATMIIACIHISYEWVFMHFILHYMFAIAAGLLVGVAVRMPKVPKLRPARFPSVAPPRAARQR